MKKTWIALTLAGALCVPLAGCAGSKTGTNMLPDTSPTAQTTTSPTPGNGIGGDNTDAANGGNNDGGTMVGDENAAANGRSATNATGRSAINGTAGTGRANNSAMEQVGEGIKDTLDDMGNAARSMAQDAKRAMQ